MLLEGTQEKCQRRQWHPTPVLLPGKSHGWRSLVGYSPWGRKESDTTERPHFHFSLSCIGEGNGNPLQCSCLENPRDGGAWWAAVYGVAQSRTRLKLLSSSSSRKSARRKYQSSNSDDLKTLKLEMIFKILFSYLFHSFKNFPKICASFLYLNIAGKAYLKSHEGRQN